MLTIDETSLPTGVTCGNPGQATVTIVDDNHKFPPLLQHDCSNKFSE